MPVGEVEEAKDLNGLVERDGVVEETTVSDGPAFEQTAVSGQQYPLFAGRDVDQLAVVEVVPVTTVETAEAQQAGESPEVDIGHESGVP